MMITEHFGLHNPTAITPSRNPTARQLTAPCAIVVHLRRRPLSRVVLNADDITAVLRSTNFDRSRDGPAPRHFDGTRDGTVCDFDTRATMKDKVAILAGTLVLVASTGNPLP